MSLTIPVYNRKEDTLECLDCFSKQTRLNAEIVMVSSCCKDGTDEAVKKDFPNIKLISTDKNIYWTTSVEKGIEFALRNIEGIDYFLTMNDDVSFKEDYLEQLVKTAEKNPKSLICSTCFNYYDNSELFYCGIKVDWKNYQFIHIAKLPEDKNVSFDNDVLTGRGTLVPIDAIKLAGNYDGTLFPQYLGDYDFSVRAKNKGFNLGFSHEAKIYAKREKTIDIGRNRATISLEEALSFLTNQTPLNVLYHGRFIEKYCPQELKQKSFDSMVKEMLSKSLYKVKLK